MTRDVRCARGQPSVLHQWSARKLQPITLFHVALIFAALIALAHFVFHSSAAVKALVVGALAFLVPLVPAVVGRVEYRLTGAGIDRRKRNVQEPAEFEGVVRWDQLDRIVPTSRGFKFYKTLTESGSLRRFWNLHISDEYSGEVQVEEGDRERVLKLVAQHAPMSKPAASP